ncbi:hypothetical protein IHE30_05800 [Mycetohabitans sp. B46]
MRCHAAAYAQRHASRAFSSATWARKLTFTK